PVADHRITLDVANAVFGVPGPGDLELVDVGAVDLIERGIAGGRGVAVGAMPGTKGFRLRKTVGGCEFVQRSSGDGFVEGKFFTLGFVFDGPGFWIIGRGS